MKPLTSLLLLVLSVALVVQLAHFVTADADQGLTTPTQINAGQAPCDLTGITPLKVTTTASTSATSRVTGKGKVRVTCSARAFMFVGAVGVTGITAGTGHNAIAANVPETFWSRGSMFAFIRDSADGVCEVAECK